jgi:Uma2 family endonuclease
VQLRPVLDLTEEQFFAFSQLNRDLRMERNARGDLTIMPPTGGETGDQNAEIGMQLRLWAKRDGTGTTFDSSSGFRLPNSAIRSPDAAWVSFARLAALTAEQRKVFIPLCPDFVIELRSPTDSLAVVRDKMDEYIANGARLAWLLDAVTKRVYVYRPQAPVQQLDDPDTISGDPVLPGFALDLREVW